MARVVIEHLTRAFRGPDGERIRAVDDASLTVEDKELLVLVGPSGCGKTTTLRLIAGLEEPDSGSISLDGQVVNHVPPKDRDTAMVFQNHALYPHLSAFENMALGLKLRRCPKTDIVKRVGEAAAILGLADCLDRKPAELSGGQRQRVALGRAIVRRPKVFLFDEPLSNLDAPMRSQMRTELSALHRRLGATMIYVTHDQVEAMALGNRIAVMKEGVIQQIDAPLGLYRHPANLFVAGFIGSPPMNLFRGLLARQGDALLFREQTGDDAAAPGRFVVRLEANAAARLDSYAGKPVIFGIRPENVSDPLGAGLPTQKTRDLVSCNQVPGQRSIVGDEATSLQRPTPANASLVQTVEATIQLLEPAGPEAYLHLTTGSHSFIARVQATCGAQPNQRVSVVFDIRASHFFDPVTEKALL